MLDRLTDSAEGTDSRQLQDLPTGRPLLTLALPGAPGGKDWQGRGSSETAPARGLRPGRGPVATSTRPQGCTGVFLLESPYPCCFAAPLPRPGPQPDPGQGAGIPSSQSRGVRASGSGCRAGSRGIPGLEAAEGVGAGWRLREEVGLWAGEEVASDRKAHWARTGWG